MAFSAGNLTAKVIVKDHTGRVIMDSLGGPPMQIGRVTFDPDTIDLDNFDNAHSTRGRVVRGFFWLLRFWP